MWEQVGLSDHPITKEIKIETKEENRKHLIKERWEGARHIAGREGTHGGPHQWLHVIVIRVERLVEKRQSGLPSRAVISALLPSLNAGSCIIEFRRKGAASDAWPGSLIPTSRPDDLTR